ncbi:protein phosphatase 2C domain-containing protein [Corynebacterium sp. P5875]|uniref:Protein phosphatase 2C domain-containing protein n=1 Tax=Corynebacterium antarcticum TaxID=2800405 RepID=A0A9Q4CBU0_9CORY|nr:protein phosphatase 2C domain-containing protein [Corynebacterium antarcticum]MCX7537568.1 protein phosphatase 2C domain-containing protein [Corynebacterium antarcticum]
MKLSNLLVWFHKSTDRQFGHIDSSSGESQMRMQRSHNYVRGNAGILGLKKIRQKIKQQKNVEISQHRQHLVQNGDEINPLKVKPAQAIPESLLTYSYSGNGKNSLVTESGSACNGLLSVRAATLKGIGHARLGAHREDSFAILAEKDSIHVAVCDGVGSQPSSLAGSDLVSRLAVELSAKGAELFQIQEKIIQTISKTANDEGSAPETYSTTLCWCRINVGDKGADWPLEVAEWGNTQLYLLQINDGRWYPLPKQNIHGVEYTPALPLITKPTTYVGPATAVWKAGRVLCILTDGISDYIDDQSELNKLLSEAWKQQPSPSEFISQISFRLGPAHDDRTAVVLWRND